MVDFLGVWVSMNGGYSRVVYFQEGVPGRDALADCEAIGREYLARGFRDAHVRRYPARDHLHVASNRHAAEFVKWIEAH